MNKDTLLLRQVNPVFIQSDIITSQVFRPTPKDNKRLSVYNGDRITPENAFLHYTNQLMLRSYGIVGVSKSECDGLEIPINEDGSPFLEHCTLIFEKFAKNEIEKKALFLKNFALKRGWIYKG
jgi:hypothetical protein